MPKNPAALPLERLNAVEQAIASLDTFSAPLLCARLRGQMPDSDHEVEKTIRRLRQRGWIDFTRRGREVIWHKTQSFPAHLCS